MTSNMLQYWLSQDTLDPALREELTRLKAASEEDPEGEAAAELHDRFYRELAFGTAGMRGTMGAGINRINVHTVRRATQAFANQLLELKNKIGTITPLRVAIAYDNRKDSDLFAFETACVFVANGFDTHLFGRLSATPLLSYAVRELKCLGGVVITASHNPAAYNGYKIYDDTGCQCQENQANRVTQLIDMVDMFHGINTVADLYQGDLPARVQAAAAEQELLHIIPDAFEELYTQEVRSLSLSREGLADLSVVYTPLNGTGFIPVTRTLEKIGVGQLAWPPEQADPDPAFTTCPEPNPEKEPALALGLALCKEKAEAGSPPDILIATDPDCDRIGTAVYHKGDYVRLSGNQIGVLLLDYIIEARRAAGTLPQRGVMVTTIVSTPLAIALAEANGLDARKVLTGFKYIGGIINELKRKGERSRFLFGFEESCGYLSGTHVRDKDGVDAAMLTCEMAALYKTQGKTLVDRFIEIEEQYGYYEEQLVEYSMPGEEGMAQIAAMMAKGREPATREGFSVPPSAYKDYEQDKKMKANVVEFDFADGSRAILRPSGTEPKLKIYYAGRGATQAEAQAAIERMRAEMPI
jgi:phosphoglucomutase